MGADITAELDLEIASFRRALRAATGDVANFATDGGALGQGMVDRFMLPFNALRDRMGKAFGGARSGFSSTQAGAQSASASVDRFRSSMDGAVQGQRGFMGAVGGTIRRLGNLGHSLAGISSGVALAVKGWQKLRAGTAAANSAAGATQTVATAASNAAAGVTQVAGSWKKAAYAAAGLVTGVVALRGALNTLRSANQYGGGGLLGMLPGRGGGSGGGGGGGGGGGLNIRSLIPDVAIGNMISNAVSGAIGAIRSAAREAANQFKAGFKDAMEKERIVVSFGSMLGDENLGAEMFETLRKEALRTGLAVEDQAGTIRRFLAMDFSADEALKLQRGILDVAGAVGMSRQEANLLGVALAQVQAKGVASMEELRQQIAEKGVPIFDVLAQKLRVTKAELFKMIAAGEVSSSSVIEAFMNLEGPLEKFRGGADKLGSTVGGLFMRIGQEIADLRRQFAEPIAEAMKPGLEMIRKIIGGLKSQAVNLGKQVAQVVKFITAAFQELSGGEMLEALKLGLSLAFQSAVNLLWRSLVGIASGIGGLFAALFGQVLKQIAVLNDGSFWSALKETFQGIVATFRAGLLRAVAVMLEGMKASPVLAGVIGDAPETLKNRAWWADQDANFHFGNAEEADPDFLKKLFDLTIGGMGEVLKGAGKGFLEGFENAGDIRDVSGVMEQLKGLRDRIKEAADKLKFEGPKTAPGGVGGAGGPGTPPAAANRLAQKWGSLASAVSILSGGNFNKLMADNATKQTGLLNQISGTLSDIAKKDPPKPPVVTVQPRAVFAGV